jgi:NAD(P)H-dependent flavin oxidoreductase YrpB (nitropropane dioxygenase family)
MTRAELKEVLADEDVVDTALTTSPSGIEGRVERSVVVN